MAIMYFSSLCLLTFVVVIHGQGSLCPSCTNRYDYDSCTETQQCNQKDDICNLAVDTSDFYSLHYVCRDYMECANLEGIGCRQDRNQTCHFCCDDVSTCKIQRDDLYQYVFPPQSVSTPAQESSSTSTASTPDIPVITSSPDPSTSSAPATCAKCGDFAMGVPCTETELLLNTPVTCPVGLPYCFETVNVVNGAFRVIKGCAEHNFCRLEWDISHSVPGCHPLDLTIGDIACTYCCGGALCNAVVPPDPNSQVQFPDD